MNWTLLLSGVLGTLGLVLVFGIRRALGICCLFWAYVLLKAAIANPVSTIPF